MQLWKKYFITQKLVYLWSYIVNRQHSGIEQNYRNVLLNSCKCTIHTFLLHGWGRVLRNLFAETCDGIE